MRLWFFIIASCMSASALADFDPAGPSIDWTGQIVSQALYHEDTCFTLRRSRLNPNQEIPQTFVACAFGYFDARAFQTGMWLQVRGILQSKPWNNLPLIGAAGVTPADPPYDPMMYPDPMFYSGFGYFPYGYGYGYGYGFPVMRPWMGYPLRYR